MAGLVVYFAILRISLLITGIQLSDYQGIDSALKFSVKSKLRRILECYLVIARDLFRDEIGMTGNIVIRFMLGLLLLFSFTSLIYLGRMIADKRVKTFYYGIIAILPIGINLVYPMTNDSSGVHAIMRYSMIFVWIFPVYILDLGDKYLKERDKKIFTKSSGFVLSAIVVVCLAYTYISNMIYTKMSFLQEQTDSYFTVLITQIKSCEGYRDEIPVAFVGTGGLDDLTFTSNNVYTEGIWVAKQDLIGWVNSYSYIDYMRYHCGFSPDWVNAEDMIADYEVIESMPVYPDNGAIKVIDNIVVVKLSEIE